MNYDEREAAKEKLLKKFEGSKDNVIRWLLMHIDALEFEMGIRNKYFEKIEGIKIEIATKSLKDILNEL